MPSCQPPVLQSVVWLKSSLHISGWAGATEASELCSAWLLARNVSWSWSQARQDQHLDTLEMKHQHQHYHHTGAHILLPLWRNYILSKIFQSRSNFLRMFVVITPILWWRCWSCKMLNISSSCGKEGRGETEYQEQHLDNNTQGLARPHCLLGS